MRVSSTDSVELEVHDLGGDGPDLLMTHGTGLHGLVWEPLARRLQGFHVWSLDARAHGDSTLPVDRPLEWGGFADDVLAVVDALGLDRPFGVGHSKGSTALLLAEEARPGTFRALYCYEPALAPFDVPEGAARPANPMAESARRRRASFASRDDAYENFAGKAPFSTLDPDALRAYVDHGLGPQADGSVALKCTPETEAEIYDRGTGHRAFQDLHLIPCPVTIALGDEALIPAAFGRAVADALADATVVTFPELGHFGPLQDPEAVARSVRAAFADDPAPLS
jgi:pimeloyl-ACP methyl ester carboxylesterase